MKYIFSTLIMIAVSVFLILLLAAKPKVSKAFTISALLIAVISGLLIYGYGYIVVTDNLFLAILKTIFSVSGSFVGNSDYDEIASAPLMQAGWMQIVYILSKLCALYATASAVISKIGVEALKRFRLWFSFRKNINLIFGTNDDALNLGNELSLKKDSVVIFVDNHPNPAADVIISSMGCILQTNYHAFMGDKKFLHKIGFYGAKKITLYALDKNSNSNIQYAARLLKTFRDINISPDKTSLVLIAQEEVAVSELQNTPQKYGYGFVTAINEPQMAARLLIMKHPPCNTLSFDENAMATKNFHGLLIGFGQVGQAVLKSIVMNGQFEGSHFKLDVFEPNIESIDGNFHSQLGILQQHYDISFYNYDARSRRMYKYFEKNIHNLRYIVISTGCEENNHELAEEFISYFNGMGYHIPIYKCSKNGVAAYNANGTVEYEYKLYCADLICNNKLDQKAMILNHKYQSPTNKTPLQSWMECDYFSRLSCRAATDFIPAILCAAKKDFNQVRVNGWNLTNEQVENLSRTEHLRWCAFHYCMGFSTMDDAEFDERANIYQNQILQDGKATIRIGKNMISRTHACLISWEELDKLSKKESSIVGKEINYKKMDTNNIMSIPQILKIDE